MYFILTILILSVSLLYSCSNDKAQHATKSHPKEVKVALSAEVNPPYLYTDKNNHFIGLDMEYMKLLEKKLPQYDFKYEVGEEESNLVGIGSKSLIWALIGSLKRLKERSSFYTKMCRIVTHYLCSQLIRRIMIYINSVT